MTDIERYNTIKYLKNIAVKLQMYEFATWVRDRERELFTQIENMDTTYSDIEYSNLLELISEYESKSTYNNSSASQVREYIREKCLSKFRGDKLDRLFKDLNIKE